jgi:hypothetical protein
MLLFILSAWDILYSIKGDDMDKTYEMIDESWTAGYNTTGWTRADIISTAEAFGVWVEFNDMTGRVLEVRGDERKLIATAE